MFLKSITSLFAVINVAFVLAHPAQLEERQTATALAPLSQASASSLFAGGPHHFAPQVTPHIIPSSTQAAATPTVTAVAVEPPNPNNPKPPTPPGLAAAGQIQVVPNNAVPITQVLSGNGTSKAIKERNIIKERQYCDPWCTPEPRYLNEVNAYPWNTIGRVAFSGGSCTGVLVGPRHVLTASHCIGWINGTTNWGGTFQFIPDYWPGHSDGVFYGSTVYYYDASAKGDPTNYFQISVDYVVVILSQYTGLPYMGLKAYNTAWNNGNYWYEAGYAANAGGTQYPYAQGAFEILSENAEYWGDILEYAACATPGDSGSPVFAWWSDGPYIVGLMTWVGSLFNTCAAWGPGGQAMLNLVSQALAEWP